jgi:hypothetical protein
MYNEEALSHLKRASSDGVNAIDLAESIGIETFGAYEIVAELIANGHPICINCCEGNWVSFGESEAVGYTYTSSIMDLDYTAKLITDHMKDLRRMLCGIEQAKSMLKSHM